jgi:RNA polymerase sigma-70 factor (ECF subfamily)
VGDWLPEPVVVPADGPGPAEVNCRKIFARARQRIAAGGQARGNPPPPARRAEGEELARRFF